MNNPTSRVAYQKYYEVFDRASESDKGCRVRFPDQDSANFFRARMHAARKIDRQVNRQIYPPEHQLHNSSAYDIFTVRAPVYDEDAKCWWLYVERNDILDVEVEAITDKTPERKALTPPSRITIDARPLLDYKPIPMRKL